MRGSRRVLREADDPGRERDADPNPLALKYWFTGIRLKEVPGFTVGQVVGAAAAVAFLRWFGGSDSRRSPS